MDPLRFDALAASLATSSTRRRLLTLLTALPLAGTLTTVRDEECAARRKGPNRRARNQRRSGHRKDRKHVRHAQENHLRKCSKVWIGPGADLNHCDLRGRNFNGMDLQGANLASANLGGASLAAANLFGADLFQTTLGSAYLRGVNLSQAYLKHAVLSDAGLAFANLSGAFMWGTNLQHADLRFATLTGAVLVFSSLDGANLDGADLTGVRSCCDDWNGGFCHDIVVCGPADVPSQVLP